MVTNTSFYVSQMYIRAITLSVNDYTFLYIAMFALTNEIKIMNITQYNVLNVQQLRPYSMYVTKT